MIKESFLQIPRDTPEELRRTLERMVEEIESLKAEVSKLQKQSEER